MGIHFIINNWRKKPFGIGAKYYPLRVVGYLFAMFIMLLHAYNHQLGRFYFMVIVLLAIIPHICYMLYRLSNSNKQLEIVCLLMDTFWAGVFISLMDFSPLPSLMIFIMTCAGNLGVKGFKQFIGGLLAMLLGVALTASIQPLQIERESNLLVMISSSVCLAVYTLYFVYTAYHATIHQKVLRKQIEIEKQRSEELLLNILPQQTALELKEKGFVDAQAYESVTVMFTDFQDFTKLSEQMQPQQLVVEIDRIYKAFDSIIGKHNIEKIKTIGDSYMCAAGLPEKNTHHALNMVEASLEILEFIHHQKKENGTPFFDIRIGIHTGPVVAGVVGSKKFTYDIWGDTVNIASRMESSGHVGRVNISSATHQHIKHLYQCTHRGKVLAKNKGEIDMYFVEQPIVFEAPLKSIVQ